MFETEAEIEELDELLDRTLAHANLQLTAIRPASSCTGTRRSSDFPE